MASRIDHAKRRTAGARVRAGSGRGRVLSTGQLRTARRGGRSLRAGAGSGSSETRCSMIEGKRTIESCKVVLSERDRLKMGEDLARHNMEILRIKSDRKTAGASFKSAEESERSAIDQISLEISQGYVTRDLECIVYPSHPAPGMKTIIRPDTGEVVREVPMTKEELQSTFNFSEGEKPQ